METQTQKEIRKDDKDAMDPLELENQKRLIEKMNSVTFPYSIPGADPRIRSFGLFGGPVTSSGDLANIFMTAVSSSDLSTVVDFPTQEVMSSIPKPTAIQPDFQPHVPSLSFPDWPKSNTVVSMESVKIESDEVPKITVQEMPKLGVVEEQPKEHAKLKPPKKGMATFATENITDFKKVIYNKLVQNHNGESNLVYPIQVTLRNGEIKDGFMFNDSQDPDKFLPELYSKHVRKCDLKMEDYSKICIKDLYKYYKRSCVELLSKYFIKFDENTFLYESLPLYIPGSSLRDAEIRIGKLGTIQRKNRKSLISDASSPRQKKRSSDSEDEDCDNNDMRDVKKSRSYVY